MIVQLIIGGYYLVVTYVLLVLCVRIIHLVNCFTHPSHTHTHTHTHTANQSSLSSMKLRLGMSRYLQNLKMTWTQLIMTS